VTAVVSRAAPTRPAEAAGGRPTVERGPTQARARTGPAAIGFCLAAGGLAVVGLRALSSGHELAGALWAAQGQTIGPVLIGVVVVVFVAERQWPAVRRPAFAPAHLVDAGYLVLFALVAPFVTLVNTGFAVTIQRHASFLVLGHLPLVPQVVVVAAILVGMDAMNWAAHVANHRAAPLWRFHALHHSQEDMSVFTTFRTHPLAHASYLPVLVPALVLGASGTVPAAAVIAYGCFVTLPHANLRWTLGPLGRFLVSPAYHRLHHARVPVAGRNAVNFGFVLVCWDRLAGFAVQPSKGAPVATGIAGRPVPIEQNAAASAVPGVVAAQLLQPLQLRSALDGSP